MGRSWNGATPKWSFLVGKPVVVGYHHFRKHPKGDYFINHYKEHTKSWNIRIPSWNNQDSMESKSFSVFFRGSGSPLGPNRLFEFCGEFWPKFCLRFCHEGSCRFSLAKRNEKDAKKNVALNEKHEKNENLSIFEWRNIFFIITTTSHWFFMNEGFFYNGEL